MVDIFNEVDEQVRSARFQILLKRGWPYAAGLVLVAVLVGLAAWILNQRETAQQATASEQYAAALEALGRGDVAGASKGFDELTRSAPRGYRTLALMQQAGVQARQNRPAVAAPLLDKAAETAPDVILGDAARLQAAYDIMDTGAYAEVRSRLEPLSAAGRPYRMIAREALALVELSAGHVAQARGDLQLVSLSTDASEAQHARAQAALALIQSGSWPSLPALAKASADLKPEAPPASPGAQIPLPGSTPSQSPAPQSAAAQSTAPQSGTAQ